MSVADELPCSTDMRVLTLASPATQTRSWVETRSTLSGEMRANWVEQKRLQGP